VWQSQDVGGLCHEADSAKEDALGVAGGGATREFEGIADDVAESKDFRALVVVSEDERSHNHFTNNSSW